MIDPMHDEYDELEYMTDPHDNPSEFVGDILTENPNDNTTRLYIQNLNGLCWTAEGGRWPYVCDTMSSIQADISCFSELNTDTNRYTVRTKMEAICKQHFDHNTLVMAHTTTKSTTAYKPGGTAILLCDGITSRIHSHTRDRMGRWVSVCLQTSPEKKLRIISAYQVPTNRTHGKNTMASQQTAQLILERTPGQIQFPNPRQAFIHDLQTFIQQVQRSGEDIVLVGDFNEDITSPQSGMHHLASTCNLIDLFSLRLGTASHPKTYQRGSTRIDYALLSPNMLPAVQYAGYDPFGYRLPSDHRGMYIDFYTDVLFDHVPPTLSNPGRREFRTSTPGVIPKYIAAKTQYLTDHRFFTRLHSLGQSSTPNHELAEQLDRDLQRASLHAAKICSRKQRPPWSPQLAQAWAEIHYYRLLLSATKLSIDLNPAIQKLQRQWPALPSPDSIDPSELSSRQKSAIAKLKQIRADALQIREQFLARQHSKAVESDDRQTALILQRIIRAESQRKVYKKIQYLRHRDTGTHNLQTLKIPRNASVIDTDIMKSLPDDPAHWETITIPHRIEALLIERNRHHFSQADGTPFTRPPFTVDVGYKADGYAVDLILSGNRKYPTSSKATQLLVHHLQQRTIEIIEGEITYDDVLRKLQNWDEDTTTSPSGLHLGHYHCRWKDPRLPPDDPNRDIIIEQQKRILQATVSLLNYAVKHKYTFHRWTKIVNVMLQKDNDNPRIHRLRVIHIYEADYNLLLAVKWRQALFSAEDQQLLNDGLYGSRPGRSAHDPALMEVLQNEMYRMSMKSGVNYDLDAASCYDRILPNIAVLCSRRLGMSSNVAHVNALTLEQSRYYLKTQLGISETCYSHTPESPVYGTGQGSGNSPMIWCFISSALFDAFESIAHGATFTDYTNRTHIPIFMTGFVDDCTQRINKFHTNTNPTTDELLTTMQKDAQIWNDLLWCSGGALEQSKCSYHLIETDWNSDGHPFLKGGTVQKRIAIVHNGHTIPTNQKSNYDAHKTLGCYVNPAYTRTQPWQALSKKNESFAQLLDANGFSRQESWVFYSSTYLPSITYSLPITPLTRSQCTKLDARLFRSLLPRCGYNRNMSRAIRYAPFSIGGAGFKELYIEQGALMLQNLVKFFNSPETTIGGILLMTASWTQAFLGTSKFFLTHPHHPIPPANPSLLLDARIFLQEINGSLTIHNPPISQPLRRNDRFIMDVAISQTRWKPRQLTQINSCRRYLQSQTLADITNLRGTRLMPHVFDGVPPESNKLRISSFNQKNPEAQAWITWRKFLRTLCSSTGVLVSPLAEWTQDISSCRQWPTYLYDPARDILMSHHDGHHYFVHHRYQPGNFSVRHTSTITDGSGYPTSTHIIMDTLRPDFNFLSCQSPPLPALSLGIGPPLPLPLWDHELLKSTRPTHPPHILAQYISAHNLITCSDGSVLPNGGFYGFIISTTRGQRLLKANGCTPGAYPNSFRSEAYGALATFRWLQHAYHAHPPHPTVRVTHYLDNQSVLRRIKRAIQAKRPTPNARLLPEHDVIVEICHTLQLIPVPVELVWIKGHQDSTQAYHRLSLPAQLNCDADAEATQASQVAIAPAQQVPPLLPHTQCQFTIQDRSITGHLKRRVHEITAERRHRSYLEQKFSWSPETSSAIDWELQKQIIKKYREKWPTIVKHLHAISPTGHLAHRNNPLLPHECPTCFNPHESNNHILQCSHPTRSRWRQETINIITKYKAQETDPYLLDILRDGLSRFHHQLDSLPTTNYPLSYTQLITSQNAIGWDQIYRGRWSSEWASLQDSYSTLHSTTTMLSGRHWLLGLGRLLIDRWLELWNMRNNDRHHRDNITLQTLREHLVHTELHQLYNLRPRMCPSDRHLFHESVHQHLQLHKSLDSIEEWIHTFRPAIQASVDQAQRLGIHGNTSLLDYSAFNPITTATGQASLPAGLPNG